MSQRKRYEPTSRELEVLRLYMRVGRQNKVAEDLGLSPKTVHSHMATLKRKMGARNTGELLLYCVREGLVAMPSAI